MKLFFDNVSSYRYRIVGSIFLLFFCLLTPKISYAQSASGQDLTITQSSYDPVTKKVTVTIKNIGSDQVRVGDARIEVLWKNAAGNTVGVTSSQPLSTVFGDFIQANQEIKRTLGSLYQNGAIKAQITVDSTNKIPESNESNNIATVDIPLPDLIIDTLTVDPTTGELKSTVKNIGTAMVSSAETALIALETAWLDKDGNEMSAANDPGHAAGVIYWPFGGIWDIGQTFSGRSNARPIGAVSAKVTVDRNLKITELDEANNSKTIPLPPPLLPDLNIDTLTFDNSTGTVNSTVKNIGTAIVSTVETPLIAFETAWLDKDGNEMSAANDPGHAAGVIYWPFGGFWQIGQSFSGRSNARPEGAVSAKVTVDRNLKITELDETNNSKTISLPPPPLPDLIIDTLSFDPSSGEVKAMMKNIGNAEVSTTVTRQIALETAWYDAQGNEMSAANDPGHSAGIIYWPIGGFWQVGQALEGHSNARPVGAVSAKVTIDRNLNIPESDEDNNSQTITLPPPIETTVETLVQTDTAEEKTNAMAGSSASGAPATDVNAVTQILPDNPFYGFKQLRRTIQEILTRDPVKKIDLINKIANEKIVETDALLGKGNVKAAIKNTQSYADYLKHENELTQNLHRKEATISGELAYNRLADLLPHEKVLEKLQQQSPVDSLLIVQDMRNKIIDDTAQTISVIQNESKIKSLLEKDLAPSANPFKTIQTLGVLQTLDEKLPAGKKTVFTTAKNKLAKTLAINIDVLPQSQKKLLTEYVQKTSGDAISSLKTLDIAASKISGTTGKDIVNLAQGNLVESVSKHVQALEQKDKNAAQKIMSNLLGGSITDLRVLSQLEQSKDKSLQTSVKKVKDDAIIAFGKKTSSLDTATKQKYATDIANSYADPIQAKVIADLKTSLPDAQKGMADTMSKALKTEIQTKVVAAKKTNQKNYLDQFTTNQPEDAVYMKEFSQYFDPQVQKDLLKEQENAMKSFYGSLSGEDKQAWEQFFGPGALDELFKVYSEARKQMPDMQKLQQEYEQNTANESNVEQNNQSKENTPEEPADTPVCPDTVNKVCGDDNEIYDNSCWASQYGHTVKHSGECTESEMSEK